MCTNVNVSASIAGSGKGVQGWFNVDRVNVGYDHPNFMREEYAIMMDFVDSKAGPAARVAVELSADSARELIATLQAALEEGKRAGAE